MPAALRGAQAGAPRGRDCRDFNGFEVNNWIHWVSTHAVPRALYPLTWSSTRVHVDQPAPTRAAPAAARTELAVTASTPNRKIRSTFVSWACMCAELTLKQNKSNAFFKLYIF